MKKILSTLLFSLFVISLKAQADLSVNYNNIHSGNSISILISKKINQDIELGGGVRFNINSLKHSDDQQNIFYNRLFATKPYHFIGIDGFINRYIFQEWNKVKTFIFYDLQMCYSTTRNRLFFPIGQLTNGNYIYEEVITGFGPFLWVENYLGLGFKVDLFKSFFLTQRIGFGVDLMFGEDVHLSAMSDKFSWEFGEIINVGLGFKF